jgi:hypothetical protein
MTSDDKHRDVNQPIPPAPPDLATLSAHPSLASLRGRGWLLDQLPTRSTAWAFVGALVVGFVVHGRVGGAVIIIWTLLTVPLAARELATHDLRRARVMINVARYGLLALLVGIVGLAATVSAMPSLDRQTSTSTTTPRPTVTLWPVGSSGAEAAPAGASSTVPSRPVWSP